MVTSVDFVQSNDGDAGANPSINIASPTDPFERAQG